MSIALTSLAAGAKDPASALGSTISRKAVLRAPLERSTSTGTVRGAAAYWQAHIDAYRDSLESKLSVKTIPQMPFEAVRRFYA